MSVSLLKKLILGLMLFYAPSQTMAWGIEGHRISGQIAESYLNEKARKAVHDILGTEPIALAGNWADFIKSNPAYSYLSPWHYIDFNKSYTYAQMQSYLQHDTHVDAYTKLQFLVAGLKRKTLSKRNKLFYLHMLIHIVEDIHQPMHVGHSNDRGGNDYKVNWFNNPTNLHAVWDNQLIGLQKQSYTKYAAVINHSTAAQRLEWQKAPVSKWVFESNQIAQKLYTDIKPGANLNYKYNSTHITILNRQLLKGGIRLAGILNQLFGK